MTLNRYIVFEEKINRPYIISFFGDRRFDNINPAVFIGSSTVW